jgi:hypothetical protein
LEDQLGIANKRKNKLAQFFFVQLFFVCIFGMLTGCQRHSDESTKQQPKQPQFKDGAIYIDHSLPITNLPIKIDEHKLLVPSDVVVYVSAWNEQEKTYEGEAELDLGALKEFDAIPGKHKRIDVFLSNHPMKYWGKGELEDMLSPRPATESVKRNSSRDRFGFEAYINGAHFEYLAKKQPNGDMDLIYCYPFDTFPHPSCQYEVMYQNLHVLMNFSSDSLPYWDLLRNNMYKLINQFLVNK